MNPHINKITKFKELLEEYVDNLFSVYDHEIELKVNNYNILARKNNAIEDTTGINYIIKEFVIARLITYTQRKKNIKFTVYPAIYVNSSFDCFAEYEDITFLISIGACENFNGESSVTTIPKANSCDEVPDTLLTLIIFYSFINEGANRKIKIDEYNIK